MPLFDHDRQPRGRSLHKLRVQLSESEALPQLTLLGLIIGVIAGGLLIVFRELLSFATSFWLPLGDEHFETLPAIARFFLPIGGALVIYLMFRSVPAQQRTVGILHVVERLTFHKGKLSFTGVLLQFSGALTALASGFSVGREGPAVHMGAGAGSILGQKLKLPENTLNALAGCGAAAAISASFNTPMAGVIFAMEVIVRSYSLGSFIPVMAASVMAALMSQLVYGSDPAFVVPVIPMASLTELGVAALAAMLIGCLAAAFIHLQVFTGNKRQGMFFRPLLLAGVLMGTAGIFLPELMGIGYDTIDAILNGQVHNLSFLFILLAGKLLLTAAVTGLGIPGGIIGPSLMIGCLAGSAFGIAGDRLFNLPDISSAFHALLGMVAMMAAVLQAPLAALITVLELTRNPHIIMPAMFAIVIACLVAGRLTGSQGGLVGRQLAARGYSLQQSPMYQWLSRTGVASLMETDYSILPAEKFSESSGREPDNRWIILELEGQYTAVINNNDQDTQTPPEPENMQPVQTISIQATLHDALETMQRHSVSTLCVYSLSRKQKHLCGVISREAIEKEIGSTIP
ncbi:MAG: chloride channel protein [Endozoicomonas sp.]